MANMVYSDPFGSFAQGQNEGIKNAIDVGTAARQFRGNDLENAYQSWYQPIRKNNSLLEQQKMQEELQPLKLNNAANIGSLTNSFSPVQNAVDSITGNNNDWSAYSPNGQLATDPKGDRRWDVIALNTGQVPSAFRNPDVSSASAHGATKGVLRDKWGRIIDQSSAAGESAPTFDISHIPHPSTGLPGYEPEGAPQQDAAQPSSGGVNSTITPESFGLQHYGFPPKENKSTHPWDVSHPGSSNIFDVTPFPGK